MDRNVNIKIRNAVAAAVMGATLGLAGPALAEERQDQYSGKFKDAWLDGKIETAYALNRHLNPLTIDTHVSNGIVRLDGTVESDIDRDLAEQIALSVDGVIGVENELDIESSSDEMPAKTKSGMPEEADASDDEDWVGGLLTVVNDATTTAVVKTKLLANDNTGGLEIDVDTHHGVVMLTGRVASDEEKQLVEEIAANSEGVVEVNSELQVEADPS